MGECKSFNIKKGLRFILIALSATSLLYTGHVFLEIRSFQSLFEGTTSHTKLRLSLFVDNYRDS